MLASALWTQWSADPAFTLTGITAFLWWHGGRLTAVKRGRRTSMYFWGAVFVIVVALNSPLDIEANRLFWVHMVQHVLLLTVAAPLLVLARPMPRVLRALPRGPRLRLVGGVRHARWGAPLRWMARPWVAWGAFAATMLVWHLPVLYDTALRVQPIHDLEHLTYIVTGLLFWNHALAIPPFARSLDWPRRVVYAGSAMLVGWVLAIVLATAPHALYTYYSQQHTRPGGISAVADQHIAAGIMWVPGSIAFTIAFTIAGYRWLEPSKTAAPRGASAAT